ncbi:protein piccolo isoform X3 [Alosa alosa]|uniref:protein piccolo isoform X3 n=1 Tax=Alosa alosa TaxID=278164 RepID=UPI0020151A3E|nr:protein piccolo isoform X3 [Alosa alosa]
MKSDSSKPVPSTKEGNPQKPTEVPKPSEAQKTQVQKSTALTKESDVNQTQNPPPQKSAQQQAPTKPPQQMPKGPAKTPPQPQPEPPKQDSGFFGFSFGGAKDRSRSQSPSTQPADVSGKVLGFGSSIFNSASSFISSAVKDEPTTTPASTQKEPAPESAPGQPGKQTVGDTKPVTAHKIDSLRSDEEKEKKSGPDEIKKGRGKLDDKKTEVQNVAQGKVEQNLDRSNPDLKASVAKNTTSISLQKSAALPASPLKEPGTPAEQTGKAEFAKPITKSLDQNILQAKTDSKTSQDAASTAATKAPTVAPDTQPQPQNPKQVPTKPQPTPGGTTSPAKTVPQAEYVPPKQETSFFGFGSGGKEAPKTPAASKLNESMSGMLFGFGGAKDTSRSRSPSPQATESVSGKMFGFGSSILSSATNLISSAVPDEALSTPLAQKESLPVQASPKKMGEKPSVIQTQEGKQTLQEQSQTSLVETKPGLVLEPTSSPTLSRTTKSSCPLCKVDLNMGSKEVPNYNTCTECKSVVCNLCGFNPVPHLTEVQEWLCLNCQTQWALGGMEPPGPPMLKPQGNKVLAPSQPTGKDAPVPDSTQKMALPPAGAQEKDKKVEKLPAAESKAPTQQGSGKPAQPAVKAEASPAKSPVPMPQAEPPKQDSGLFGFGLGGLTDTSRSRSPSPQPGESVSGKVMGFGSSFFSSASNLITSAVQDEPTPPTARKESVSAHGPAKAPPSAETKPAAAAQKPEMEEKKLQNKKPEEKRPQGAPQAKVTTEPQTKESQQSSVGSSCPLCKVPLNIGSKDPPNFNSCTQCKATVCNLCGFNPTPHLTEAKEWLCLNCQMKQAPGPPVMSPQPHTNKTPTASQPQTKMPSSPQKKEEAKPPEPTQQPQQQKPTQKEDPGKQQMPKGATSPAKTAPQPEAKPPKQESSLFGFGLGGITDTVRSRSPSPQPAEFVSGKVMGFGSSLFSSASNLITSAVQDEPSPTPPTTRKESLSAQGPAKAPPAAAAQKTEEKKPVAPPQVTALSATETKPPAAQKQDKKPEDKKPEDKKSEDKKPEVAAQAKAPSALVKKEEPPAKAQETQPGPSMGKSSCPLCKVDLNIGSKDPPNYNTCTECKTVVCNLCGFNPMPHLTEVKEWLCLNCQTQRALRGVEPPAAPQEKRPQDKPSVTATTKTQDPGKPQQKIPEGPPPAKPAPLQEAEQQKQEGGLFGFGFGGAKDKARSRSPSPQPAESVSGKVFGFGSSFLSSASNLITSAVQDETPVQPPSRKGSIQAQSPSQPASRKGSVQAQPPSQPASRKGSIQAQPPSQSPSRKGSVQAQPPATDAKPSATAGQKPVEKKPEAIKTEEPAKTKAPLTLPKTDPVPKAVQSCPLCKVDLNMGSKDPPNYNTCTECKNTVCNLCGFNPMPHLTEVKDWLCLTCQMQRATAGMEPPEPPMIKPPSQPTKAPAMPLQKETPVTPAPQPAEPAAPGSPKVKIAPVAASPKTAEAPAPASPQKAAIPPASPKVKQAPTPGSPKVKEEPVPPSPKKKEVPTPLSPLKKDVVEAGSAQRRQSIPGVSTPPLRREASESGSQNRRQSSPAAAVLPGSPLARSPNRQPSSPVVTSPGSPLRKASVDAGQTQRRLSSAGASPSPGSPIKKETVSDSSPLRRQSSPATGTPPGSPSAGPESRRQSSPLVAPSPVSPKSKQAPTPGSPKLKEAPAPISDKKKEAPAPGSPLNKDEVDVGSPNRRQSSPAVPATPDSTAAKENAATAAALRRQSSPAVARGQVQKPASPKLTEQPTSTETKPSATPPKQPVTQQTPPQKGPATQQAPKMEKAAQAPSAPKQESGFFSFGFGGKATPKDQPPTSPKPTESVAGKMFGLGGLTDTARSRSPSPQPAESVSGKVMGFGSSFFSSASNLITSAVQDEPTPTPPATRKESVSAQASTKLPVGAETKPPAAPSQEKEKPEVVQVKEPPAPTKKDETPSKPSEVQVVPAAAKTSCPLCKVDLNRGSKDPPNYNSCTECKNIVCNQCGFNPMPHVTEVKEWLCLNCQMQRALGGVEPPGPPVKAPQKLPSKVSAPPSPQKKEIPPSVEPPQSQKPTVVEKPPDQLPAVAPQQKPAPQQEVGKPPQQPSKGAAPPPAKAAPPPQTEPPKQESGFFGGFGFGGAKDTAKAQPTPPSKPAESATGFFGFGSRTDTAQARSPSPQPAESVSGKVMGFGSSFFSSASNLITSTVQDETSPTPPTARKESVSAQGPAKAPPAADTKPPAAAQKPEEKKPEAPPKVTAPSAAVKKEEPPAKPSEALASKQPAPPKSSCPLCKVDLNIGSKDTPNYNTCTECKNMVCNLCGFNPMPHLGQNEWLCLNCQTQRALAGQLGDMEKMPAPKPQPAKAEKQQPAAPPKVQPAVPKEAMVPIASPAASKPAPPKEEVVSTKAGDLPVSPAPAAPTTLPTAAIVSTETPAVPPASAAPPAGFAVPPKEQAEAVAPQKKEAEKTVAPAQAVEPEKVLAVPAQTNIPTAELKQAVAVPQVEQVQPSGPKSQIQPQETQDNIMKDDVKIVVESSPTTEVPKSDEDKLYVKDVKDIQGKEQDLRGQDIMRISPESYSSAEEELRAIQKASEVATKTAPTEKLTTHTPDTKKQLDSIEDSSESEPSPLLQRKKVSSVSSNSEDYKVESPESMDDEEFIRRQLMEMGADVDLSPSEEDSSAKKEIPLDTAEAATEKPKRVLKKLSVELDVSPDHSQSSDDLDSDKIHIVPLSQTVSKEDMDVSNEAAKHTKTIDTAAAMMEHRGPRRQSTEDADASMESLVDSIDDRSKGDGSSSLHASSFTPGTASPTSVSSLDEDSDSSPRNRRKSGEGKHKKAKHRQHGQGLPTIEDSSEEDILGEGDQLRDQEKQTDVDQQLSKKVPRREKIRIKVNKEELLRTSGSELSPSIESEAEDVTPKETPQVIERESSLPSISPYIPSAETLPEKPLKSADQAYEEMMQKAKAMKSKMDVTPPAVESLYGGMSIEDYAYESLVEGPSHTDQESEASMLAVQESMKKLRTPEEVYEEMLKNGKLTPDEQLSQPEIAPSTAAETCYVTIIGSDGKPHLEVQQESLTPGTSPSQTSPVSPVTDSLSYDSPEVILIPSSGEEEEIREEVLPPDSTSVRRSLYPIPDLKIIQCSSGEEEPEEGDSSSYEPQIAASAESSEAEIELEKPVAVAVAVPTSAEASADTEPISVVCEVPQARPGSVIPVQDTILSPEVSPSSSSPDSSLSMTTAVSSSPLSDQTPVSAPVSPAVVETQAPVIIPIPDIVSEPCVSDQKEPLHAATSFAVSKKEVPSTFPPQVSAPTPTVAAAVPAPVKVPVPAPAPTIVSKVPPAPPPKPVIVSSPDIVSAPAPVSTPSSISKPAVKPKPVVQLPPAQAPPSAVTVSDQTRPPVLPLTQSQAAVLPPCPAPPQVTASAQKPASSIQAPIPGPVTVQMPNLESSPTSAPTEEPLPHPPSAPVPQVAPAQAVQSTAVTPSPVPVPVHRAVTSTVPDPTHVVVQMPDLVSSSSQTAVPTPVPTTAIASASTSAPTILPAKEQIPVSVSVAASVATPPAPASAAATAVVPEPVTAPPAAVAVPTAPPRPPPPSLPTTQPPASVLIQMPAHSPSAEELNAAIPIAQRPSQPPPPPLPSTVSQPQTPTVAVAPTVIPAALPAAAPVVSPTITTTVAFGTHPLQSVVVDIQSGIQGMQPQQEARTIALSPTSASPQILPTVQTRQGHVVIIVPRGASFENISVINQSAQEIVANSIALAAAGPGEEVTAQIPTTCIPSAPAQPSAQAPVTTAVLSTPSTSVQVSAPPVAPKPLNTVNTVSQGKEGVSEPPLTPSVQPVSAAAWIKAPPASVIVDTPSEPPVVKQTVTPTPKPIVPPPVPPKPTCIPAGLKFTHRPGEIVRPPLSPQPVPVQRVLPDLPKAATLPRTREPPNALSFSLTTPVQSKFSATSPKSPLSPRFARCLETYVVITLPSEPGSPVEGITTQAPLRRGSLPFSSLTGSVSAAPLPKPKPQQVPFPPAPVPQTEQIMATSIDVQVPKREVMVVSAPPPPPRPVDTVVAVPPPPVAVQMESVAGIATTQQADPRVCIIATPTQAELTHIFVPAEPVTIEMEQLVAAPPASQPQPEEAVPLLADMAAQPQPMPSLASEPAIPPPVPMVPVAAQSQLQPTEIASDTILRQQPQQTAAFVTTQAILQEQPVAFVPVEATSIPQQNQPLAAPLVAQQMMPVGVQPVSPQPVPPVFAQTISPQPVPPVLTQPVPPAAIQSISPQPVLPVAVQPISPQPVSPVVVQTISPQPVPHAVIQPISPQPVVPVAVQPISPQPVVPVAVQPISPQPVVPVAVQPISQQPVVPVAVQPVAEKQITYVAVEPVSYQQPMSALQSVPPQPVDTIPAQLISQQHAVATLVAQPITQELMGHVAAQPMVQQQPTEPVAIPPFTQEQLITFVDGQPVLQQQQQPETLLPMQQRPLHTATVLPPSQQEQPNAYPAQVPFQYATMGQSETVPPGAFHQFAPPAEDQEPLMPEPPTAPVAPVTYTQFTQSIASEEIIGPEKVVSSVSQVYSAISTTEQQPETMPKVVTQVVTTEVQRTTMVSVVQEIMPEEPAPVSPSASVVMEPETSPIKVQSKPKQNGRIHYPGDVIDLCTSKVSVTMTDKGMDLTAPESSRQSFSSDSSGRHSTAVQPEVVNLSAEITPATTLSVVTDSITIVTCSATIASYNNTTEKPLDLGNATSMPLPLTTYTPCKPVAQIVYRPVNSHPKVTTSMEIPVNLSYGTVESMSSATTPVTIAPGGIMSDSTGVPPLIPAHTEAYASAVDLTTSKPVMVALTTSSGVVTTIVEDDGTPVDLTAGRRAICCDVIYKLPFTGSCRTQQPATTMPDNRFGYRDDHYQYGTATTLGITDLSNMKSSVSDNNFSEAGLFYHEGKNGLGYHNGASDGAIDLTSAKMSTADEALDYSSKGTRAITIITTAHQSVLRSTNGIVYSSIAEPIPSTYAITTQPGSIFTSTYNDLVELQPSSTIEAFSTLQNVPTPYGFIPVTAAGQIISHETGLSKEILPAVLANLFPGMAPYPEIYSDATLEAIAASLDTLLSPNFPGFDDGKDQQYYAEREFLELEKLKQLCLAEELEWERQEIQRFREQEQMIVQKEIEELQNMKHQLLLQQEEERQAHLILQQETFAQQQVQLEQIQQLQQQLQQQLDEQKIYPYGRDTLEGRSPPINTDTRFLHQQYIGRGDGQYWPVKDDTSTPSLVPGQDQQILGTAPTEGIPESARVIKDAKTDSALAVSGKKIVDSGVQTDDEDCNEKPYPGRRRRNRRSVDSCVQTDDEDQDEWDTPIRSRRKSRSSKYGDSEKCKSSKVSSIAIQTVAEISVQTDHSGTIRRSPVRAHLDTKIDFPGTGRQLRGEESDSDESSSHTGPIEIGITTHLKADGTGSTPKSPKVLYSPVSPMSPNKSIEYSKSGKGGQKMLTVEHSRHSPGSPRSLKPSQRSLSDKSLSPTTEDRMTSTYHYSENYASKGSQSGTPYGSQKKVKRTLPHPPPEEDNIVGPSGYSTGSARRRMCRNTTMARAKILQDIDKELDLVERESSKLRKKQAELDEEEKEIDAKLRYLEMGINRRKDALLKEREKRERAYLQGVAEERDYMSDSEVSNIREARRNGRGLERPRTAPQSEFNQFIPAQTDNESQYGEYYQYAPQTQADSHYPQQTLYQQQSVYHQQVSPYQTQSVYSSVPSLQQSQQTGYQHASQLMMMQQKPRQSAISELEPKITTNYEVIHNQPLLMVPSSTESTYGVSQLGGKYSNLDLRMALEERGSMASSPMSSISAESFYTDIDHHNARNYVLIDDIGELTKGSSGLSSSFTIPDKDMTKADRLLRAAEVRRTAEVADFLGSGRLSYGKTEEDSMEEPYELKLLKQQIKQEFRRGTEGLDPLTGLPHYLPSDSSYRHFPKSEKYSISRLTLEKQAAKQLPASVLYQKQLKQKKAALMDPKITKFSPIQESRDLEPDYSHFLASTGSSVGGLATRARLLQDEITFGLRKNVAEQQKYLGSTLGANLAQSLNLGQSLNLSPGLRSSLQDDGTYPSGTRSRPSSRPSSVYGLDLSIKRDLSSSSLRLKSEGEGMDTSFGSARAKPTSLPISQSRGRIPIVAQNSEEESPLSPVGQPMGMARASAGPLPPISADSRDQFGSSHSLPEVQQHMREESRTRGYDRDIAFIMDDLQGAMSDSEALSDPLLILSRDDPTLFHEYLSSITHGVPSWNIEAYHLRQEESDWFDKPRIGRPGQKNGQQLDSRQMKSMHYPFPHTRLKLQRDPKDNSVSGNGLGIRVVGGKEIPGANGDIGAYIAKVTPGGHAEQSGKVVEGMQVLEWNGIALTGKTYEEVQTIVGPQSGETELCVRLDLNMLADSEHPQHLELHTQMKAGDRQRSPGVDPKQLAAELQKVSQQQAPGTVLAAHIHSGTASATSSAVPSPGQPGSPSVNKKRHGSKSTEALKPQPHPITGEIQLQINYDKNMGNLIVHVLQARNLAPRDNNGYSDPFVKVYLLPGRGAENKRRTKSVQKSQNPEWNQTVIYKNIHLEQLKRKTLEVTVWDYDRYSSNDFLGEVLIDLSNTAQLDNTPRWLPLKEQSESIQHGRAHPPQGPGGPGGQGGPGSGGQGGPGGSGGPGGTGGPGSQQSPKTSVIKSRSHGIFPDPAKDSQMPTMEKSHSSPGSSKSSSEGHLRSHGPSRSQSKSSVTQAHLEEAGNAIAAAEAAVQQARLQPNRTNHRITENSTMPGLSDDYRLDAEDGTGTNAVDSAIFQVPQLKNIPNGIDKNGTDTLTSEGKTQVMGEIRVALKKEMKTEGEQLVLEILQCRNITYKFKSPDHLPDLYVKLYVVNVATQKRIIKKKTRVCRHDREPSFNETFRFSLNPAGHSIQLFLVSNGGKFMKKTLIGEAYIWLDKVDMRKRAVSWHKLLVSSQTQP